jgi:hypothetical protein
VPVAVQSGGEVHYLATLDEAMQWSLKQLLIRKHQPAPVAEPPAVST